MQKLTALLLSIVGRLENGLILNRSFPLWWWNRLIWWRNTKDSSSRTLLDNADIWIFDEPVAAMRIFIKYNFFNAILYKKEDDKSKTMIFVSHRLKIASKMNRIIYLENGKIVGIGTHQHLWQAARNIVDITRMWLLMENDWDVWSN